MIKIVRSVFIFVLVTVLASCEYWNKDMLGYLEYWSSTVQMGRVEVTDVTIQKNDSGVDTISASSTPTITGYIINPQSYQLLAEIGDSSNTDKSIRISNPTVQVKAQLEGYDPTMLRIKLNPADSSLEHTDFRVDFEAIRQETMQSSGQVMGVTLRYNTPPIAPTPIIKNDDTGEYFTVSSGQIWKADRGGYVYWAYDDSITDEKDPNCAKWFTINGTRHLVADCSKVPNVQVGGLNIFKFKTDYSNTTLAAVDVEGVSSSTLTSGQAVPPATYVIKYDANGATGGSVPASQNKPQYTDITLARNEGNLTRIGYRFLGWNTSPDGNGQDYAEGATYSDDAGVTLYAKWDVVKTVTFTPGSDTVDHGDSVIIYPPAGATIHYSTDEGVSWENGSQDQPVTITLYNETNVPQGTTGEYVGIPEGGEVTITAYAVHTDGSQSEETSETYSLNQYTVTYDGNSKYGIESTVSGDVPQKQEFYSGASIIIAEQGTLKRVAHTFGGWNTKNDGSGETYNAGDSLRFTGDTPLYAKWVPMTDFYVSSSTGSDQDLSHDGSESKPFKTIGRALHFINQFNNGTQSFIIHVSGNCVAEAIADNNSVVNIVPDKTLNLTIQGKDGHTATINATTLNSNGAMGRVMYVGGKANVTLQNITLTGGSADYGGGVYIDGGTLIMETGSSIKNNTANDQGGGVYIAGGTLKMETDSSINGNTASNQGGGVFINNGEFNMTGGTISGNTVTSGNGGGVFVKDTSSTFNMSGGTISGNKATGVNGTDTGLGGGVYNTGTFEMSGGTIGGTTDDDKNTASLQGGGVYINDGSFTMSGGTISGNEAAAGRSGIGGGVFVRGGTFTMIDNATISNNKAITAGGVYNTSTFKMSGGTISDNAADDGGGVYNTSSFEMTGGTISGNTASNEGDGGGVYVTGSGTTFIMENGAIISGNTAGTGGGVYNTDNGEFTMKTGATISGNSVKYNGGGVYVTGSGTTFTMENGAISGNTARNGGGGGVDITDNGEFTMNSGTISSNTAGTSGGGVFLFSGTFTMNSGTISSNTARDSGGGVCINDGSFTMSGSAIVNGNNDVYLSGKTITVNSALTGSFPVATITPRTYNSSTQVLSGSRVHKEFGLFKVTEDSSGGKWGVAATGMLLQYTSAADATDVLQNLVAGKSVSFDMTSDTPFTPLDSYANSGNYSPGKDYAIHVPKNTTLVINGNNNFLKEAVRCGDLLKVEGTLVLNDVKITGTNLHASVIEVLDGAMVILNNCIIENNNDGRGTSQGVINIMKGGTAIMNGGKIEGNYLAGVTVEGEGSFTIKGGGVIQNNQKGGVRKEANATYVNEGGTVDKVEDY